MCLVFILNYKPCDIPLKYVTLIKKRDHIRPTYLNCGYINTCAISICKLFKLSFSRFIFGVDIQYHGTIVGSSKNNSKNKTLKIRKF